MTHLQALNEEAGIAATVASLARMIPSPAEIIVADGGSTDRSACLTVTCYVFSLHK